MNEDKLVSILISFYNEEKYLAKCIQSVLDSTYSNFEIILINDASTDKSEDIVRSFEDPRIVLLSQDVNMGQGHCFNLGLDIAKGDYVGFLGADDILEPDKIQRQVDFLIKHPDIILVSGGYVLIDENDEIISPDTVSKYLENDEIRAFMLFGNCISCGGGALFRREIIGEHHVRYDESIRSSQDYKFFLDCLKYGKVANENAVLFRYRRGSQKYTSHTQQYVKANKRKYQDCMRGIFSYAWSERGFNLKKCETDFIYNHFYLRKRFYGFDKMKSKNLYKKIMRQGAELGLSEQNKILEYYMEFDEIISRRSSINRRIRKTIEKILNRLSRKTSNMEP